LRDTAVYVSLSFRSHNEAEAELGPVAQLVRARA
jgi:hypothetical protein